MTSLIRAVVFTFLIPATLLADTVRGIVTASDNQPLAGAGVALQSSSVQTGIDGRFAFDVPSGTYRIRVTHDGFQPQAIDVTAGGDVTVAMKAALAENIVVSGIRADAETPVTKSNLSHADIEKRYYGQDIPMLLRDTPSINAYAEGGIGGAGYSYISLRGISPTRLNFTFDGIPLADSEDMGAYFVDFPDLAHSLESIQIQRGVGTSTVGSPSFGGSINLESIAPSQQQSTEAWLGAGSFGTRLASVGYQSGALAGGYAAYGRLSIQETGGFREHSGVRQHNFFFSGAKQNDTTEWKLTGFSGRESQHESFFASDEDTLKTNLRDNPLSPDDRDSFGYTLAEAQYMRENMTASVFFQRGYGWYRLDGSQYNLDGLLVGSMVSYTSTWHGVTANYGAHVNHFRREHSREDYFNFGTKDEANGFAKFNYDLNHWRLYSDLQVRSTDFHYHGDVAIAPIRWTFFNPKLGARYEMSPRMGAYVSAGLSRREPTRNDLFQGEDNATFAHDLHAVKPERLVDMEAGVDFRGTRGSISANVYAMEFHNEIAATGELSDIGLALRRNVDRSYRRGIEIENTWRIDPSLRLRGSASLSRNRIRSWTQFYDVYDAAGNVTGSRGITHLDVNPVATPPLIINQSLDYTASHRLTVSATGRYVAKSYLDNTNNDTFTTPSFFALDGSVAFDVSRFAKLQVQINNILDSKRIFPSGYSYLFLTPAGSIDGIRYYYPQATRNFVVTLDVRR